MNLYVATTGGRDMNDRALVFDSLDAIRDAGHKIILICHGACPVGTGGSDWLTDDWANDRMVPCRPFPPDPRKGAGRFHSRNHNMCAYLYGKCFVNRRQTVTRLALVAFPGGRGTSHTIRQAASMNFAIWHPAVESQPDWDKVELVEL